MRQTSLSDLRELIIDGESDDAIDAMDQINDEIKSVLMSLDELTELWGDEGKFRRCRDRLRHLVK